MESVQKGEGEVSYVAILSVIFTLASLATHGLSAVLGLVFGIVAWRRIRRSGGRLKGQGFALTGMAVSCLIIVYFSVTTVIFRSNMKEARLNVANADIKNYSTALDLFELDNQFYPTREQGLQALVNPPKIQPLATNWRGPYVSPTWIRNDPWGKPYIYKCPGTRNPSSFDLYSAGPNKIYGDDDDVILGRQ